MDDRTCPAPGCTKNRGTRQRWCPMHSRRMRVHRTLDPPAPRSPKPKSCCSVTDCDTTATCKGLCIKHYTRLNRTGSTTITPPTFATIVTDSGYVLVGAPGHVLTEGRRNSGVYEHRLALFDRIGYGPHRCSWCHRHVNWNAPRCTPDALEADHLDNDRCNNRPTNLTASCHGCNSRRALARRQPARRNP